MSSLNSELANLQFLKIGATILMDTSGTNVEVQKAPVQVVIRKLIASVEELEKETNGLHDILKPVLSPPSPDKPEENKKEEVGEMCPLGRMLADGNNRINRVIDLLKTIIHRVEV